MKQKKSKKAKPVKAWGLKKEDGTLEEESFCSRWQADDLKRKTEKVVRVEIREI